MRKGIKNYPEFTHFASLPFIRPTYRENIWKTQQKINSAFQVYDLHNSLKTSSSNLAHLTLSMLTLNLQKMREQTQAIIYKMEDQIKFILNNTCLTFSQIKYFSRFNNRSKRKEVTIIYLDVVKDDQWKKIVKVCDVYIRAMLKSQIIVEQQLASMHIKYDHNENLFKNQGFHLTLFRVDGICENQQFLEIIQKLNQDFVPLKMNCDYFDISTRAHFDGTKFYEPLARLKFDINE